MVVVLVGRGCLLILVEAIYRRSYHGECLQQREAGMVVMSACRLAMRCCNRVFGRVLFGLGLRHGCIFMTGRNYRSDERRQTLTEPSRLRGRSLTKNSGLLFAFQKGYIGGEMDSPITVWSNITSRSICWNVSY